MNILLSVGGLGAAAASLFLLVTNVSGACSSVLSLLYCAAFVGLSVVGGFGLKGVLPKK